MPKYKPNLFLSSTKFAASVLSAERRLLKADHLMSNPSLSDNYKIEIANSGICSTTKFLELLSTAK